MTWSRRWPAPLLVATLVLHAGCGGASVHTVDAPVTEAGFCGTHANPGLLDLRDLQPPKGGKVANSAIVHGFTVINAPAVFSNFDLKFGPTHTAGLPNPENPKFTLVTVGSNIAYQLTIVSWRNSPGHVELSASAGFETAAGCSWSFPSPLFSYDISGGPDGGLPPEPAGQPDGAPPVDAALDAPLPLVDASLDGVGAPVDAAVDSGAADVPIGVDLGADESNPGLDLSLAVDAGAG